jgi:hypothetical protein
MKEGSNNSDKIACPRSVDMTRNILTYNQQLPIKDKAAHQQAQELIEKKGNRFGRLSFRNNIPVPA